MSDLHPGSLEYLYQEPLYRVSEKHPAPDLSFHGTNLKNVTVLVDNPEGDELRFELHKLLSKILESIGLEENDVAIVDAEEPGLSFETIQRQLEPKLILVFGHLPEFSDQPENEILELKGTVLIRTHSLAELDVDRPKKAALWRTLQGFKGKF